MLKVENRHKELHSNSPAASVQPAETGATIGTSRVSELGGLSISAPRDLPSPERQSDDYERISVGIETWREELKSAQAKIESKRSITVKSFSGFGIEIVDNSSYNDDASSPALMIGTRILSTPTSRNFREVAILHELGHVETHHFWQALGPIGVLVIIARDISHSLLERAANRWAFRKLEKIHGGEDARRRMIAAHGEMLSLSLRREPSVYELATYLRDCSPFLLKKE